jgi:hypothetical protein
MDDGVGGDGDDCAAGWIDDGVGDGDDHAAACMDAWMDGGDADDCQW